jgi:hypothetical protein
LPLRAGCGIVNFGKGRGPKERSSPSLASLLTNRSTLIEKDHDHGDEEEEEEEEGRQEVISACAASNGSPHSSKFCEMPAWCFARAAG